MNAVEIEEAISALAEQPFDAEEFPFAFLEAFGNRATTIKRLRGGSSNKSDLGGVLRSSVILPGVWNLRFGSPTRFIRVAARFWRSSVRSGMPAPST